MVPMSAAAIRLHLFATGPPPPGGPRPAAEEPLGVFAARAVHRRSHSAGGMLLADRLLAAFFAPDTPPPSAGDGRGPAVYGELARRRVQVEGPVRPLDLLV